MPPQKDYSISGCMFGFASFRKLPWTIFAEAWKFSWPDDDFCDDYFCNSVPEIGTACIVPHGLRGRPSKSATALLLVVFVSSICMLACLRHPGRCLDCVELHVGPYTSTMTGVVVEIKILLPQCTTFEDEEDVGCWLTLGPITETLVQDVGSVLGFLWMLPVGVLQPDSMQAVILGNAGNG